MYALEVRDHIMIAHSLRGRIFGPAQQLHGATFVVDVAFFRETLDEHHVVVDIGRAAEMLKATLAPINYANLDEVPALAGKLTTTEFLSPLHFRPHGRGGARGPAGIRRRQAGDDPRDATGIPCGARLV